MGTCLGYFEEEHVPQEAWEEALRIICGWAPPRSIRIYW